MRRASPHRVVDEARLLHQNALQHLHILANDEWDSKAMLSPPSDTAEYMAYCLGRVDGELFSVALGTHGARASAADAASQQVLNTASHAKRSLGPGAHTLRIMRV